MQAEKTTTTEAERVRLEEEIDRLIIAEQEASTVAQAEVVKIKEELEASLAKAEFNRAKLEEKVERINFFKDTAMKVAGP